ncbi:MAG: FAD-dependent oxidoreductase [Clostridia bacterium]|nr:FAD-dependent oxidoreductase [Clostridia bacterium]
MQENIKKDDVLKESKRCLNCANPMCSVGCPFSNKISNFIKLVKEDNITEAYDELLKTSFLSTICGYVCPSYKYCMKTCVMNAKDNPINIKQLERYVAENNEKVLEKVEITHEEKVALIGTGPSSIMCAYTLINNGYYVTMFEKESFLGGLLSYGIPYYRLPKKNIQSIEKDLLKLGVDIKYNAEYGKDVTEEDLLDQGYKAIYFGIGLSIPSKLGAEGEDLKNIYTVSKFLYHFNLNDGVLQSKDFKDKKVIVVGAGEAAFDAAITAKKLTAKEVTIIYRRSKLEMSMNKEAAEELEYYGITFEYQSLPIRFIGDENGIVKKVECIKMDLGDIDSTGRRIAFPVVGSNYTVNADVVIECIGNNANIELFKALGVDIEGKNVKVDRKYRTNKPHIFIGGDLATCSGSTVSFAGRSGIEAAKSIMEYLENA